MSSKTCKVTRFHSNSCKFWCQKLQSQTTVYFFVCRGEPKFPYVCFQRSFWNVALIHDAKLHRSYRIHCDIINSSREKVIENFFSIWLDTIIFPFLKDSVFLIVCEYQHTHSGILAIQLPRQNSPANARKFPTKNIFCFSPNMSVNVRWKIIRNHLEKFEKAPLQKKLMTIYFQSNPNSVTIWLTVCFLLRN